MQHNRTSVHRSQTSSSSSTVAPTTMSSGTSEQITLLGEIEQLTATKTFISNQLNGFVAAADARGFSGEAVVVKAKAQLQADAASTESPLMALKRKPYQIFPVSSHSSSSSSSSPAF